MKLENIRYVFDISNGEFRIRLNNNDVIKYDNYNDNNVVIGVDKDSDIVCITIKGFREYMTSLIDKYISKQLFNK